MSRQNDILLIGIRLCLQHGRLDIIDNWNI